MLIKLDDDTVEAIVSGLIHAEVYHEHDAKQFVELADRQDNLERRQELEDAADYHRLHADRFRRARAALREAKKEASGV